MNDKKIKLLSSIREYISILLMIALYFTGYSAVLEIEKFASYIASIPNSQKLMLVTASLLVLCFFIFRKLLSYTTNSNVEKDDDKSLQYTTASTSMLVTSCILVANTFANTADYSTVANFTARDASKSGAFFNKRSFMIVHVASMLDISGLALEHLHKCFIECEKDGDKSELLIFKSVTLIKVLACSVLVSSIVLGSSFVLEKLATSHLLLHSALYIVNSMQYVGDTGIVLAVALTCIFAAVAIFYTVNQYHALSNKRADQSSKKNMSMEKFYLSSKSIDNKANNTVKKTHNSTVSNKSEWHFWKTNVSRENFYLVSNTIGNKVNNAVKTACNSAIRMRARICNASDIRKLHCSTAQFAVERDYINKGQNLQQWITECDDTQSSTISTFTAVARVTSIKSYNVVNALSV